MWKVYLRTGLLCGAFFAGILVPRAAAASGAISCFVMLMLFIAFLRSGSSFRKIRLFHGVLLLVSLLLAAGTRALLRVCGAPEELADAAFYIAFTPTAAAAPVVMGMLGGNVELVAVSTVFTNLAAAGLFPLILIGLNGEFHGEIFWDSARSVGLTVILPAVLASLYRKYGRNAEAAGKKLAPCSFYLWIVTLFLVSAKAGVFLREQSSARAFLLSTASAAGILCALHFWLGSRIGKYFNCPREGSQALGQKNTSLTIYLAMTYSSPAAAMGPAFYIFFHNFWNACQLHRYEKTKRKEKRIHESGGF